MTVNGSEQRDAARLAAVEVVPLESCLDLARRLQALQHPWRSHVLPPDCDRNSFPRHAVVIEDDRERRVYAAPSRDFPEVDRDLVRMLHGNDIVDRGSTAAATGGRIDSALIGRVRAIDGSGRPWHHHMCFSACAFNPEPGRWTIDLESGDSSWSESWDDEPVDVLREIEVMFFNP